MKKQVKLKNSKTRKVSKAKPRLYLLHGWAYQLDAWQKVKADLELLGWPVELLAIPGLTGESIDRPWTITDYTKWLDKQLPSQQEVVLIGHSNGGRIGLNYCQQKNKAQIKQLVLIGSAGIPPRRWQAWRNRLVSFFAQKLKGLKAIPGMSLLVYRFLGGADYDQANALMKPTLVNLLQSDYHLDVPKIKLPVSLIWGMADKATPLWQADRLQQQLPNVIDTFLIPGAGHNLHRSHHKLLADMIDQQLQDLLSRPKP